MKSWNKGSSWFKLPTGMLNYWTQLDFEPGITQVLFKGAWGYDFPWEGTYWYLQCMRRIKCHMTNVPISSPFFVSQAKRNGESTQLVWKQIPFRLRDSPIMHSSVPDEFKPVIFAAGSGCEWVGCFSGLPKPCVTTQYCILENWWTLNDWNSKMILCNGISDSGSSQAVTSSEVLKKDLLISCVASGNDLNVQNSQKCWESKADSPSRVNSPGN